MYGGEVLEHGLQFQIIENDMLPGVVDDASDKSGEEARVPGMLRVMLVLVQTILKDWENTLIRLSHQTSILGFFTCSLRVRLS